MRSFLTNIQLTNRILLNTSWFEKKKSGLITSTVCILKKSCEEKADFYIQMSDGYCGYLKIKTDHLIYFKTLF